MSTLQPNTLGVPGAAAWAHGSVLIADLMYLAATRADHEMKEDLKRLQAALAHRYTVEREIGRGGMAIVYLAEDCKHQRKVALKVLRPELAASVGAERFLGEIATVAKLTHPNILPLHDSGDAEGTLYFTMPYLYGASVRDRLDRERQLPAEDALQIAHDVAEALGYAHAQGIIHRDIKPENVLLQAGKALVADFGIARAVGHVADPSIAGLAVGSPPYMSPEQALGNPVDQRADIYSLGAVLYEMLAGGPPFAGQSVTAVLAKVLSEDPPPLRSVRPELPAAVEAAVARAMARRPADRYQTVDEMLEALKDTLASLRNGARGDTRGPRPVRVAALFGIAAAAALAVLYSVLKEAGLPAWTFTLAAVLLAVGIPLQILTAVEERRRRAGTTRAGARRWFTWRNWAAGGVVAVAAWAAVATVLAVRAGGELEMDRPPRVAVLPFENLSAAEDEYFSRGIVDEIRGGLVDVPNVRVIARGSSDAYAGSGRSPREIGSELGADYILTGTVRWGRERGDQRHVELVSVLTDVRTGKVAWSRILTAGSTDVVRVRAEIVVPLVDALDVAVGAAGRGDAAMPPTMSPAAYDAYLRALEAGRRRGDAAALRQAVNLFERAVAIDSTFVGAWIGLGRAASGLYIATADPAVGEQARSAVVRAHAMAPQNADAHDALVQYYLTVEGDAARAADEASQGLRVSPGHAGLLVRAAFAEQLLGRWEDALGHLQEAAELDPRSAATAGARGYLLLRLRRYGEAHAAYDRALALDPVDIPRIIQKAMVHLAEGNLDAARAVIRSAAARVDETELALQLATYYDLYWLLDEDQQNLVLRLPPSAYLRDRAEWSLVQMQVHAYQGHEAAARAYADSARAIAEAALRVTPDRSEVFTSLGLALAYLRRPADAIRAGRRALELLPMDRDAVGHTYAAHQLVRIYLLAGEPERAIDQLEALLAVPYYVSPGWLRVDPTFAPLRGKPRFERLAKALDPPVRAEGRLGAARSPQ
jgi:TolB-like protein/tetratricopeptide (TPR) repeat protein/tRNA A-37 threonylcarbamoyl transferase component Bud32